MRCGDAVFVEPNPGDEWWPWQAKHIRAGARPAKRTFKACGKWSEIEQHSFDLVEYIGKTLPEWPGIEIHEMRPEPEPSEPVRRQVGGDHYMNMGLQPIDVMESVFSPAEVRGFYLGNLLKYTMRAGRKAGASAAEDIGKARHYAELLESYERKQKVKGE
jgi:hypothetical protein